MRPGKLHTVQDDLQTRGLDHLIEGIGLGDIGHKHNGDLGAGMSLTDLGGLVLGADRRHNLVTSLEEQLQDVRWS